MAIPSLLHPSLPPSSIPPFIISSLSRPGRQCPPVRPRPECRLAPCGRPSAQGVAAALGLPDMPSGAAASSLSARAALSPPSPGCGTAVPGPSRSPGPSGASPTSLAGSVLSPAHRPGPFSARRRPLRRFCPHSRLPQAHPPSLPFPCPCDPIPAESGCWASRPARDPCFSRRALSPLGRCIARAAAAEPAPPLCPFQLCPSCLPLWLSLQRGLLLRAAKPLGIK